VAYLDPRFHKFTLAYGVCQFCKCDINILQIDAEGENWTSICAECAAEGIQLLMKLVKSKKKLI